MWWNFVSRLLLGIYELVLSLMIIYAPLLHQISFIHFSFECGISNQNTHTIIQPKGSGWGFLTMQNVLICLSVKFSQIVFYTIPYKYKRIRKSV
jgi:hypothetical protein